MNKGKYRHRGRLETQDALRPLAPSLKRASQPITTGRTLFLLPILAFVLTLSNPTMSFAQAPTLTIQPTNRVVLAGGTATFAVSASGTGPFEYQWRFNGTNLPYLISTVAGNGTGGYSGDGGRATNAELFGTLGVTIDGSGNLFIADVFNNRIRKVDTNGIITTVAGNGVIPNDSFGDATGGYSGDGGPATNAELNWPEGVAVDALGNLYIADYYNSRIRKVDTNGIITTIAGNGVGGDNIPATNSALANPSDVALDGSGNLFIAEFGANSVRKIDTNGIITTVAGGGSGSSLGDGGPATNAVLSALSGIALDQLGNLFIADTDHSRIRKVDTNGIIMTVAGNGYQPTFGGGAYSGDGGPATNAALNDPLAVAADVFGNLFIADTSNYRIRKVGVGGIITTVTGDGTPGSSGDGGPAPSAAIAYCAGVAIDGYGNLFFGDDDSRVRKIVVQTSAFVVTTVGASNVGNYDVVISSQFGSVTSSVAALTILVPPIIVPALTSDELLKLSLIGTPGRPYILQAAAALITPVNWQPVFTNVADANGNWSFTNTTLTPGTAVFYRILSP